MSEIILTGVDSSETALEAARKAAQLARALGGTLHLVSAYDVETTRNLSDGIGRVVVENPEAAVVAAETEKVVAGVATTLRREYDDVEITASIGNGATADVIVHEAERLEASLIVVGNKRVQGLGRILGSIARSVAAAAPCDVYVANTHGK